MPRARPKVKCPSCQGHKLVIANGFTYAWYHRRKLEFSPEYATLDERITLIRAGEFKHLKCTYTWRPHCPYKPDGECKLPIKGKDKAILDWLFNHGLLKCCDVCESKGRVYAHKMVEYALKGHWDGEDT